MTDELETTESEVDSDDEDITLAEETFAERIAALKDIVPPTQRKFLSNTVDTASSWISSTLQFSGKSLWVISTSALLLGVPWALAFAEEQQLAEMEREMKMQQGANEVCTLWPVAAGCKQWALTLPHSSLPPASSPSNKAQVPPCKALSPTVLTIHLYNITTTRPRCASQNGTLSQLIKRADFLGERVMLGIMHFSILPFPMANHCTVLQPVYSSQYITTTTTSLQSLFSAHQKANQKRYARTQSLFARRLLPGLGAPFLPPFIFLTLNFDTSAAEVASLLLPKRFLPPKPYFSSRFARLWFGLPAPEPDFSLRSVRSFLAVIPASSRPTSKRSASLALPISAP